MSQQALIESAAFRCEVDVVSRLPASQSGGVGPRKEGGPVCETPVLKAVGSLTRVGGMTRPDIAICRKSCCTSSSL